MAESWCERVKGLEDTGSDVLHDSGFIERGHVPLEISLPPLGIDLPGIMMLNFNVNN